MSRLSVMSYLCWLVCFLPSVLILGCATLLPKSQEAIVSGVTTFEDARKAYDKIVPYRTTAEELKGLGFDPYTNPNVTVQNFLDVMTTFVPANPTISVADLPEGVQACLQVRERCEAYKIELGNTSTKREGYLLLDMFRFTRHRTTTGWSFQQYIVLIDSRVVHKVWSGTPEILQKKRQVNPLGPLQDPFNIFRF